MTERSHGDIRPGGRSRYRRSVWPAALGKGWLSMDSTIAQGTTAPRSLRAMAKSSSSLRCLAGLRHTLPADAIAVAGLIRRRRQIAGYLRRCRVPCLHLGAGNNVLPGWLNTDLTPASRAVIYLDVTNHFPFPDNTFKFILSEHMIEHLTYKDGLQMLSECLRVLKPGGRLRLATPDLDVLLALNALNLSTLQKKYIDWIISREMPEVESCRPVFVINNAFRAWGHQFLYSRDMLFHALTGTGYADVSFFKPGESETDDLRNLESHGREVGNEDMNTFETVVVEGCKPQQGGRVPPQSGEATVAANR